MKLVVFVTANGTVSSCRRLAECIIIEATSIKKVVRLIIYGINMLTYDELMMSNVKDKAVIKEVILN